MTVDIGEILATERQDLAAADTSSPWDILG